MDLSGVIFVALAIGWAVYLIPKALQQHDELARSRSVERFSSRLRVLGGHATAPVGAEASVAVVRTTVDDPAPAAATSPVRRAAPTSYAVSRAAARRAAARRRRVLVVLTALLVLTAAAATLSYVPWWSVAVPVALVLGFLVVARLTVRAQRARAIPAPVVDRTAAAAPASGVEEGEDGTEDTVGVARAALDAALGEQPVADDGALWDPLPMTLPTYVSKPRARRTVRTIELTRGVTSAGHDVADSQLVRDAEEVAEEPVAEEQRRVAGA